jgi:twitching motility protein PilU
MSKEQASNPLERYMKVMADNQAADMYFVTGAPPNMKCNGKTIPVSKNPFKPGQIKTLAYSLLSEEQITEFAENQELNISFGFPQVGRFRINIFVQRTEVSMVIRYIKDTIPEMEELGLPKVLKNFIMEKTGLVLVVGSTGSGKSTTLASMINYRNRRETGHMLTIEDPIEFVFRHDRSIISQREVGIDTRSYENALREAMREAPEVIMIGEARDRETMQAAINYADTGHLCLTTLHAVNSNQALDRIVNMFPSDMREHLLMDLSLNLKAVVSQRLLPDKDGKLVCVVEVMRNSPHISELIREGSFKEIKEVMEKGETDGMQTFDQSLFELYQAGRITKKNALTYADSSSNLEWKINFGGDQGAA